LRARRTTQRGEQLPPLRREFRDNLERLVAAVAVRRLRNFASQRHERRGTLSLESRTLHVERQRPFAAPLKVIDGDFMRTNIERRATFFVRMRMHAAVLDHDAVRRTLVGGGDPIVALNAWQDQDVKAPPLKKLQGLIWESGYKLGVLRSPIFSDALSAIRRWKAAGLHLYVYSSGSVEAQLLFFEFSTAGDLRPLFSGHYDTDVGSKVEPASYIRIAEQIGVRPDRILFFSDRSA